MSDKYVHNTASKSNRTYKMIIMFVAAVSLITLIHMCFVARGYIPQITGLIRIISNSTGKVFFEDPEYSGSGILGSEETADSGFWDGEQGSSNIDEIEESSHLDGPEETADELNQQNIVSEDIEDNGEREFKFDTEAANLPGTANNPYWIESKEDLEKLAGFVNKRTKDFDDRLYSEKNYLLMNDLELNGAEMTPIGIYTDSTLAYLTDITVAAREANRYPFKGTFDGGNHTISNFSISGNYNSTTMGYVKGFFGLVDGAVIKQLNLENGRISNATGSAGVLVGYAMGDIRISDCNISGAVNIQQSGTAANNSPGTGGVIGWLTMESDDITPTIENVVADVAVTAQLRQLERGKVGGLIGYVRSGNERSTNTNRNSWESVLHIRNCTIENTVTATQGSADAKQGVGGIIGEVFFYNTDGSRVTVEYNQMNADNVSGVWVNSIGGIVGYLRSENSDYISVEISNNSVKSSTIVNQTSGSYIGGAVGQINLQASNNGNILIKNNQTEVGKIESSSGYAGGMVGQYSASASADNILNIKKCEVNGEAITSSGSNIGGLIGRVYYSKGKGGVAYIEECDVNVRTITGANANVGGMIGFFSNSGSDGSSLMITDTNVHSEEVYNLSTGVSGYRTGGAIGYYEIDGTGSNNSADESYFKIVNCEVKAEVYSNSILVGGFLGEVHVNIAHDAQIQIENCISYGNIRSLGRSSGYDVGGMVGRYYNLSSRASVFIMKECTAYGNVETVINGGSENGGYAGGLIGHVWHEGTGTNQAADCIANIIDSHSYAEYVVANGTSGWYVGGLIGAIETSTNANKTKILLENCSASGNVSTSVHYAGGLVGYIYNSEARGWKSRSRAAGKKENPEADMNEAISSYTTIRNCYATGDVYAKTNSSGGLLGYVYGGNCMPHDVILVENCYASGDVTVGNYAAGGLIGKTGYNVTVKNSYATGDVMTVSSSSSYGYYAGGLIGHTEGYTVTDNRTTVLNCYATGNVVVGTYGGGGLIGHAHYGFVENSYATGSVHTRGNSTLGDQVGGLIGWITYGGNVSNCYASGNVSRSGTASGAYVNRLGGLIGYIDGLTNTYHFYLADCMYDKTTTQLERGLTRYQSSDSDRYLHMTENDVAIVDITGFTTSQMINFSTYKQERASWGTEENHHAITGRKHTQTAASPWYIDDNMTYPYLYYQADGFTESIWEDPVKPGRTDDNATGDGWLIDMEVNDETRNYSLGFLGYSAASGGTFSSFKWLQADYSSNWLASIDTQYLITSAGAAGVYFPYVHGTSAEDYNQYHFRFDGKRYVYIPAVELYQHKENTSYSLGSFSATNITAFSSGPFAEKISDRPVWNVWNEDTYTHVGRNVTYTIHVGNHSILADWNDVIVEDMLAYGVTLEQGEPIYAKYGNSQKIEIAEWDGSGARPSEPCYTYKKAQENPERFMLTFYIGDFPAAQEVDELLEENVCSITFVTNINREAATVFLDDGSWEGDNIRNRGIAAGEFKYIDEEPVTHQTEFDDNNRDPVYNGYQVIYNSNYTMEGIRGTNDIEIVAEWYPLDGSGIHIVLHNEDQGEGGLFTGFGHDGYEFINWFYYGEDGETPIHIKPGEELKPVDRDIILFANWKVADFTFYKVNANGAQLRGAVFELYRWNKDEKPEKDEVVNTDSVAAGYWELAGEYTSERNKPIKLVFPQTGYYQLRETSALRNYVLHQDQWRFEVFQDEEDKLDVTDPEQIEALDNLIPGVIKKVGKEDGEDRWELINYRELMLSFIKVSNVYYSVNDAENARPGQWNRDGDYDLRDDAGDGVEDAETKGVDALAGAVFELYMWTGGEDEPDLNELVTQTSIDDGKWIKYGDAVSDSDGKVEILLSNYSAVYQLVEKEAPEHFQLPAGQWRFSVENSDTRANDIAQRGIKGIKGEDGVLPPAFKIMGSDDLNGNFAGSLALVNHKAYVFPPMGGSGPKWFLIIGGMLVAAGWIWDSVRKRRDLNKERRGVG